MARLCSLLHKHVILSDTRCGDGQLIDLDACQRSVKTSQ
jgi:hypothetical protein